jgi:hypothetical protein
MMRRFASKGALMSATPETIGLDFALGWAIENAEKA